MTEQVRQMVGHLIARRTGNSLPRRQSAGINCLCLEVTGMTQWISKLVRSTRDCLPDFILMQGMRGGELQSVGTELLGSVGTRYAGDVVALRSVSRREMGCQRLVKYNLSLGVRFLSGYEKGELNESS